MTLNWAPYQAATGCTPYGPAGAQALLTYTEDVFAELHRSMGICNCRTTRGGSSFSHHAECRALDAGFERIVGATFAYDYAVLLGEHGALVGLDHIITNRKPWATDRGEPIIFSARSPNGRVYTGVHPHKDHNHMGLTRNAGRRLTYATLVSVYGRPEEVAAKLLMNRPGGEQVLDENSPKPSEAVAHYQRGLIHLGYDLGNFTPFAAGYPPGADGRWGGATTDQTKAFQGAFGLAQTGKGDGLTVAMVLDLSHERTYPSGSADAYTKSEADARFSAKHGHPYASVGHGHNAVTTITS